MFPLFKNLDVVVDPGSANFRVGVNGKLVFNQPSLLSLNESTNEITGYGHSINNDQTILKPFDIYIANFQAAESLLRASLNGYNGKTFKKSLNLLMGVPMKCNSIHYRAYLDIAEHANSRDRALIPYPYAALIGFGLKLENHDDIIIIDIGSQKTEISLISESQILYNSLVPFGSDFIKKQIKNQLLRKFQSYVNEIQLENVIKEKIDLNLLTNFKVKIDGLTADDKTKTYIQFTIDDIVDVLDIFTKLLKFEIENVLQFVKLKKLDVSILNRIYFVGGGSKMLGLKDMLTSNKVHYHHSSNEELDIINGLNEIQTNLYHYKHLLIK